MQSKQRRSAVALLFACTRPATSACPASFAQRDTHSDNCLQLHANVTNLDKPTFTVDSLPPASQFNIVIYSTNSKGRSHAISLTASTLGPPEKQMSQGNQRAR